MGMRGIAFSSASGNHYFYDDDSGLIFPNADDASSPYDGPRLAIRPLGDRQAPARGVAPDAVRSHHLDHAYGFRHLILELTADCNLRCRYCVYSENYPNNRTYTAARMPASTARDAIDAFMRNHDVVHHRNPSSRPIIGFYGGEPLLAFDVMQEAVEHFEKNYRAAYPTALFSVTTNGMLLEDAVQDFLVEHGFSTIVSIDGPKDVHDRNRLTVGGRGSFEQVERNVDRFRERHPGYDRLAVSVCYDLDTDFEELERFFDEKKLFVVSVSQINPNHSTYYSRFTPEQAQRFLDRTEAFHRRYVAAAREDRIEKGSFLYSYLGVAFASFAFHPVTTERRPAFLPYTGTCVPGEKLYVATDGTLHMCERINPHFPIGSLAGGIDYARVAEIIDRYNEEICGACAGCPLTRLCDRCFATTATDRGFALAEGHCQRMIDSVRRSLVDYVDIAEARPDLLEDVTIDYHRNLLAKVGFVVE